MSNNDQLVEAQIEAMKSQTKAFNRVGNSLEQFVKNFGETSTKLQQLHESLTTAAVEAKEVAKQMVGFYTSTEASFSEMASHLSAIKQGIDPSKRSTKNPTTPHAQHIDLNTSSGFKAWNHGVKLPSYIENWDPLLIGPESRDKTRDFANHLRFNGFLPFLSIPTKGDGKPLSDPKTLASGEQVGARNWDGFEFLCDTQNITRKNVQELVGLIHGNVGDGLHIPQKLIQKTLDLKATGNNGNDALLAADMQQSRIRSEMIMHLIREIYDSTALASLDAHRDLFTWTRESDGTEFYDGIMCLWLILEAIEPKTVIDANELENTIATTKLLGPPHEGDVRAYLSKMKRTRDELIKRHGNERFSEQRYLQAIFQQLMTIEQPTFKQYILSTYTSWTANLTTFDATQSLNGIDSVYASLLTSGDWDVTPVEDPQIIALSTKVSNLQKQLRDERKKNKTSAGKDKDSDGKPDAAATTKWREVRKGPTIIAPDGKREGETFFWCQDHNHGKGMYMPSNTKSGKPGHDHAAWQANKDRHNAERDAKKRPRNSDDSSAGSAKLTVDRGSSILIASRWSGLNDGLIAMLLWIEWTKSLLCVSFQTRSDTI